MTFLRSIGIRNPDLSPELVRDDFETICALNGGQVLVTQKDLQAVYSAQFALKGSVS